MLLRHVTLTTVENNIEGITLLGSGKYREYAKSEADARAKMLIYLLRSSGWWSKSSTSIHAIGCVLR
jgi:hypothetical protein